MQNCLNVKNSKAEKNIPVLLDGLYFFNTKEENAGLFVMACGELGHVNIFDEAEMTQNNQRFQTDLRCRFSLSSPV